MFKLALRYARYALSTLATKRSSHPMAGGFAFPAHTTQ